MGAGAVLDDATMIAIGFSGLAGAAAVKNQDIAEQRPSAKLLAGDDFHQVEFELDRIALVR